MMDGPEACYRGVREQFRQGAEFIKICATGGVSSAVDDYNDQEFSPEELNVIISEAKRHNTYVTAHCTGTEGMKAALKAGMLADIVMVDGNPLDDIKLLAHANHVRMVLIGGKIQKNTL